MNFHFSTFLTHMTTYWTVTVIFMVSDYLVDTYNTYNHYKISNEKINWKKYKK